MGQKREFAFGHEVMNKVGAIVLGGGRGTRLYPLTKVRAKPAVPLCGRYRLVDIPLSNCIHSGIKKVVVLTQFNSHSLHRHINSTYRFDTFTDGFVDILAAEQTDATGDWFQGTADAVRKQIVHVRDLRASHYVILSGDQLYRMDYRTLLETHFNRGADITVSALPVNRQAARGFGIMQVDTAGRIRSFVEKPTDSAVLAKVQTPAKVFADFGLESKGKPYLGSMGVYVFRAEVLEGLLEKHPEWDDFGKEVIPNSLKSHKVYAHMFAGFWEDIGSVRSYFDVSMEMISNTPPFNLHDPEHPIFTHLRALPGVKVEDARVSNSIVCGGSQIARAKVSESIIGIRSIIQSGVEMKRCIMLGAEYYEGERGAKLDIPIGVGPESKVSEAIIDHNARIGRGVVIRGSKKLKDYDGDGYVIRDGIVVVFKNAVIPDGARIG